MNLRVQNEHGHSKDLLMISSNTVSLLQSFNGSSSSRSLFDTIYGGGSASSADPVAALTAAEKNQTKAIDKQAKDPQTKRDIDHFTEALAKAKDIKSLLADPIARKVLLTANGLGDQADYTALATKALQSDTSKAGSLASKLSDTRWLDMAKTYDFANKNLTVLKQQSAIKTVTSGYAEVQWRQSLEQTTPGLSAALEFRSRAGAVKKVDDILGDSNLRKVVTTALGLPQQIAFQSLEAQEKAITNRLDITKLRDPKFVEQFARRFLIVNATNTASSYLA